MNTPQEKYSLSKISIYGGILAAFALISTAVCDIIQSTDEKKQWGGTIARVQEHTKSIVGSNVDLSELSSIVNDLLDQDHVQLHYGTNGVIMFTYQGFTYRLSDLLQYMRYARYSLEGDGGLGKDPGVYGFVELCLECEEPQSPPKPQPTSSLP